MKKFLLVACVLSCFVLSGCAWNARMAGVASYGADHKIELYSGGELVREWISDGKVASEKNSDGYYFQDRATGKFVRVTGDLVITPE